MGEYRDLTAPVLKTELPGPKVKEMMKYLSAFLPSYAMPFMKDTDGIFIRDLDDNIFLDFISGRCVHNIGYNHPDFVEAVQGQVSRGTTGVVQQSVEMMMKLNQVIPGNFEKIPLCCLSGSAANDLAIKVARRATGNQTIVAFAGSYHGVTYGALSLTSYLPEMRKGFGPLLPGVEMMPYPYCYRCPFKLEHPECDLACLRYLDEYAFKSYIVPEEVAAISVEPIQGDGGWHVPPDDWLPRVREICDEHDILLIAEEVQTGFGRTGEWFAVNHWDVVPDITVLGKSIAGGVPNAAAVVRGDVVMQEGRVNPLGLLNTLSYNPLSSVATCANIDIIMKEGLVEKSAKMGEYVKGRLVEMMADHKVIGDVRGKGLMIGVEIVKDKESKKPAADDAERIVAEAFSRGLYLVQMGSFGTGVLRVAPPLIINREQVDSSLEILEDSISTVEKAS